MTHLGKRDSSGRTLVVKSRETPTGFVVIVEDREFPVEFPPEIWAATPADLRRALLENLVFGNTHFLPLMLGQEQIHYDFPLPLLESFLFKNQLFDLTSTEKADEQESTAYLRPFYNLSFEFERGAGALPDAKDWPQPDRHAPTAILPFSFGKESLATTALCLEIGIRPVLVYCQEPVQPYEEAYKVEKLREFGGRFGVETHFIRNAPGLFRYGKAYGFTPATEVGWGSQATLLALLALPFARAYNAEYILFGNEFANNETGFRQGWRTFSSFDQTSYWAQQQNHMIRILSGGQVQVKSSLEPLEEISIFNLLHRRYPEIGRYQFSCSAEEPLYADSQWCHACYKCARMYLFARCCDIDPNAIGFKKDLLRPELFSHYFGAVYKTGFSFELDFAFYVLYKRHVAGSALELFEREKLPHLKPWRDYWEYFTALKPDMNLPDAHKAKMVSIFSQELARFREILPPLRDRP
jgi:hypothetical protein